MLRMYSDNERAIRAYLKAGFREMGRRRLARRSGNKRLDVVCMDCLPGDLGG